MPQRTEVEKQTRNLVALDVLYKPFSSLGDKGRRRVEKDSKLIAQLLKEGEEKGERVFARVKRIKEEKRARTIKQGIDTFKKEHPRYGEKLQQLIDETREKQNRYLVYGVVEGFKLGEEDYVRVMMDLGFDRREASAVYPHILAISERLGKASEQAERTILVSKG